METISAFCSEKTFAITFRQNFKKVVNDCFESMTEKTLFQALAGVLVVTLLTADEGWAATVKRNLTLIDDRSLESINEELAALLKIQDSVAEAADPPPFVQSDKAAVADAPPFFPPAYNPLKFLGNVPRSANEPPGMPLRSQAADTAADPPPLLYKYIRSGLPSPKSQSAAAESAVPPASDSLTETV